MSTFYDDFTKNWIEERKHSYQNTIIYAVSSNCGYGWEYLPKKYTDLEIAKSIAQTMSKADDSGRAELWRVSRGNVTIDLYLNGEEVKENG